ncbi:tetratricopeptide repeat protein [Psychroserpens sp. AS72]|uniref:tetratricopeptide repeat protein n=1 Tax=Psychroserpens sp. AS72 TaxID=3135775 RepID=UPI00316B0470
MKNNHSIYMKVIKTTLVFLILLLSFPSLSFSQEKVIDSLKNVLLNHKENDTTKVNLLNALSSNYSSFDSKKSEEKAQEANSLAKQLNYKKGEARSFIRLSINHRKKSELDEAEEDAISALNLYEEINDQDGVNATYISLGILALNKNDLDKALEYFEKVLNYSKQNGDLEQQASMLNNIGVISHSKGNLDDAVNFFKQSYVIREQLGNKKLGLGSLNNIGAICLNQGKYTEALKYFNKCLSIHREDNNKDGIALATINMSAVYYEWKQYDKTLRYLEESLELSKEIENRSMIASCLINIGAVYADLKEFDKALDYMTASLYISKEINDKSELSAGNFQLGDLRLSMGEPIMALENYKTCLELSVSSEDKIYTCHAHIGLAQTYVALENYSKALDHALKGKQLADDLELLAQQKLASGVLASVYDKTGNYKKAFESHQLFKKLNDSLFNNENIEKITQLEYEYKYKQALDSASIRELKLTKTLTATNSDLEKSKQSYLWAIIGFLMVSILLGGVIFYQKYTNVKSKAQNIEIEQKLLRSQMTPHFIFNSLSVLQGMILNKEDKKSVLYLSKFSKLLRITLENSRDKVVPLHEELTAVNNYLELQNLEVSQTYQYTILVDENIDTTAFEIPPMLIQPFIENAIEHGFQNQKEDRKIDIQLKYSNKDLICTIKDNGIGINFQKTQKKKHKRSLATTITNERLKIVSNEFKTNGSVTIENRQKFNEQGTIVTLVIPYKKHIA